MPTPTPTPFLLFVDFGPYWNGFVVLTRAITASAGWQVFLFWLKVLAFGFIGAALVAMIILIAKLKIVHNKLRTIRAFLRPMKSGKKAKFQKEFEKIKHRILLDREEEDRLSILEVDKLLERSLKELNAKGDTILEKLEAVKPWQLPSRDEVFRAHKIRDRIVHEPGTPLTHFEAEGALKIYEQALRELGVIE